MNPIPPPVPDPTPPAAPGFVVKVDDNYHYQDTDERYTLGVYPTLEAAREACITLVVKSLMENYRPGISADDLYDAYTSFGEDPWIVTPAGPDGRPVFSAWDFAKGMADYIIANSPVDDAKPGASGEI